MFKLKWKILIAMVFLILLLSVSIFLPIYWNTRISMEEQLQNHLAGHLDLIAREFPLEDVKIQNSLGFKKIDINLLRYLNKKNQDHLKESIFLFEKNGLILAFAGDGKIATKTLMLHNYLFQQDTALVIHTPVFQGNDQRYYLSVFKRMDADLFLGISANARFFENLSRLRRQMILTTLISLILTSLIALFFSSSLTKPLQKLTVYASQIGRGSPDKLNYNERRDEIGTLYKTLVEMQGKIKIRERENKQIVASVAHELRNPIAGMQVNIELLMEELQKDSDSFRFSQLTHRDILKLAEIVDSFLNYSRPIDTDLEIQELGAICREILEANQFKHQKERFHLQGRGYARIHKSKIHHALSNILQNALDASEDIINISINETHDWTRISIENFGNPVSDKSQIFEAFFSTKENGVGLGLPIAKSIVEQHGGEILLEKSDATGTVFVILLPAANESK
ncbi:MAG: HAMP domain-containing histidine kinase [Candidatus Marinimicrobia bacterium]|nr:HAMP domain-containing histidine kinase [Candidatus Neomarinimicrobiota bacterium]